MASRIDIRALCAWAWLLIGICSPSLADNGGPGPPRWAGRFAQGQPIDRGFVILEGRYLSRPYVVERDERGTHINGNLIAADSLERNSPQFDRGNFRGPAWGRSHRPGWLPGPGARIEQHLRANALLVQFDGDTFGIIPLGRGVDILRTLASDEEEVSKIRKLSARGIEWVRPGQWAQLVETFEPTAEFVENVSAFDSPPAAHLTSEPYEESVSDTTIFAITLAGIILGALALGTLLSYRPKSPVQWRGFDSAGDGVPLIVCSLAIVVLLSLFDLGCTLILERSGMFREINPLADRLMNDPGDLIAFKVATLVASVLILFILRRYRGAQLASWWLSLVFTIVTFRWATFGSLFLT